MTSAIELSGNTLRCEIAPPLGASAAELGACVMQPRQSMSAEMSIQVERVA